MTKLGLVETDRGGGLRCVIPEPAEGSRETPGVRITRSPTSFELIRAYPHARPVYYRVDYGRLEWSYDLACFEPASGRPTPPPGTLLTLLHGSAPAPGSSLLPGVHRLATGTVVRVTGDGITVTRRRPVLPDPGRRRGLVEAVAETLGDSGYAIAYSGGMGSAFVAACALSARHRPLLVHADLGSDIHRTPLAEVPGLTLERIRIDPSELLDEQLITGEELIPPMPDREVPRRLAAALARAKGLGDDVPLVGGTLMRELTSAKLSDVDKGLRGWRLLGCEPFHVSGTLPTLTAARTLLAKGMVYAPDAQPLDAPAPPSPTGSSGLPGLLPKGEEIFGSAHRAAMAVWREHLDFLGPLLGAASASIDERGDGGLGLPALDPRVLAAAAVLEPAARGRIRGGVLESHRPLRRAWARHGIAGVRRTTQGHWLRRAAAGHLYRERKKIVTRLGRDCALADLGLVDPQAVIRILRDGRDLADNALPLLRLVWLERWLRGGS